MTIYLGERCWESGLGGGGGVGKWVRGGIRVRVRSGYRVGGGLLCIYVNNSNYILVIIKYEKVRMTKKAYAIYIFTSESMTDLMPG